MRRRRRSATSATRPGTLVSPTCCSAAARTRSSSIASQVDRGHPGLVVAVAGDSRQLGFDPPQIRRRSAATSAAPAFCSRYSRRLVPGSGRCPRPGRAPRRSPAAPGVIPFSSAISAILAASFRLAVEVLAGEARAVPPEVALVELVGRCEPPRQEAAAERRVRHEPDPELAAGRPAPRSLGVARSTASTRSAPR